jgi:DNA-binding transcriptional LysR family regulator
MLDLRLLHQALTLARHRNFARAAQALHLTQPALSRSIAGLEATLGEKLFDRTHQGVEPTAFGQMLLARAHTLVDGANELERDFELMRGLHIGELRIGAGAYPAELSVSHAVGRLVARHPELRVQLTSSDLRSMIAALLGRRLDLVVIERSMVDGHTSLAVEALPEHPAYYFCRPGHPLAGVPQPSVQQVFAFPFVGTRMPQRTAASFLQMAKVGHIDPDTGDYVPPIKVDSIRAVKDVVMTCDAVGIAPLALIATEVRAGQLRTLPLRLDWMHTQYGFAYLRERQLSPAALAFMAELRGVEAERSGLAGRVRQAGEAPQ